MSTPTPIPMDISAYTNNVTSATTAVQGSLAGGIIPAAMIVGAGVFAIHFGWRLVRGLMG